MNRDTRYHYTHLDAAFFEHAVLSRISNPNLIVEIGSFKGGSAITMAKVLESHRIDCPIICVDTFLGDANMWLNAEDAEHVNMDFRGGRPSIYQYFMINVMKSGFEDRIVPLPVSSLVGMEILKRLEIQADVLYLDSAHKEGETYLEIFTGFSDVLHSDGIMIGDDYRWPAVAKDVNRVAEETGKSLVVDGNQWGLLPESNLEDLEGRICQLENQVAHLLRRGG